MQKIWLENLAKNARSYRFLLNYTFLNIDKYKESGISISSSRMSEGQNGKRTGNWNFVSINKLD